MEKNISTAVSVAITFLITLALNTAVNFYTSDRGRASVSRPVTLAGKSFVIVSMENYSRDFVDSLAVEVPKATNVSEISADQPVSIELSNGHSNFDTKLLVLSKIPPRTVARIFVSLADPTDAHHIRILNSGAVGLKQLSESNLDSPLKLALIAGSISALFYALIMAFVRHQQKIDQSNIEAKLSELRSDVENSRSALESSKTEVAAEKIAIKKEVAELSQRLAKQRILLVARLSDYAKELDFWRGTVKQLLVQRGGTINSGNELLEFVTRNLQTYGTAARSADFDSIRVAAAWLSEKSQSINTPGNTKHNIKAHHFSETQLPDTSTE